MEPLLFYGVPGGCSLASIIALEWLGQPYKLCRIEMLQHPWPPEYARVNPRMKTPALFFEPDYSLTESAAILQHIAARGIDSGLGFRQGTIECDRLAEVLSYLTTDFFTAFAPLWAAYETENLSAADKQRLRDEGTRLVTKEFGHVEGMLRKRTWLLDGEMPTVADAYLFAVGRWADYHQVFDMAVAFPAMSRHKLRLQEMPAVRFAVAVEGEGEAAAESSPAYKGHVSVKTLLTHLSTPSPSTSMP